MINTEELKSAITIERVIGSYLPLKKQGNEYIALCPFHAEKTPSFTVTPAKGLWHCFGCQAGGDVISFVERHESVTFERAAAIVAEFAGIEVGTRNGNGKPKLTPRPMLPVEDSQPEKHKRSKLVATYPYVDENGDLVYEVQRWEPGRNGSRKEFKQRRKHADGCWIWGIKAGVYRKSKNGDWYPAEEDEDGEELPAARRVLFRLPQVIASGEIWIVEGEKDVLTLESLGFIATTNSGGSNQEWLPDYTRWLSGKRIILIPDSDAPGEKHARKIEAALKKSVAGLVYVALPPGVKDVTEYIESGANAESLLELVANAERDALEKEFERRGLLTTTEVLNRFEGGYNAFIDVTKRPKGVLTGYSKLDAMTLGLHPGELFILAARPSMGKTALALNISHVVARRNQGAVAIFSLEMSAASLLQRIMCAAARVDSLKFRSGRCDTKELSACRSALAAIAELPLLIDDSSALTLAGMHKKLTLVRESQRLALVVLDYLQLALGSVKVRSAANRVAEVSELTRGLKLLAREFKTPFLVLSQLSRKCEDRPGDHRPLLADLRESGSIEQDADTVAFIWRGEVYYPNREELRGVAELIVAKQRNGPTGTVPLAFLNKYTKFEDLAEEVA